MKDDMLKRARILTNCAYVVGYVAHCFFFEAEWNLKRFNLTVKGEERRKFNILKSDLTKLKADLRAVLDIFYKDEQNERGQDYGDYYYEAIELMFDRIGDNKAKQKQLYDYLYDSIDSELGIYDKQKMY